MVARDYQSTVCHLNAVTGTGGIPRPRFVFCCGGDFSRFRPSFTVVGAGSYPDSAWCFSSNNLPLRAVGEVLAEKEPDCALNRDRRPAQDCRPYRCLWRQRFASVANSRRCQNSVSVQCRYPRSLHHHPACLHRTPNSVPSFDRTSAGIRNVWYPSVPALKRGLSVLCIFIPFRG